jgi:hypothetical protein
MAKRSNLYEVFFGPDDSRKGLGYGQTSNGALGSERIVGSRHGIYDEPDAFEYFEDEENFPDIKSKIDGGEFLRDPGAKANRYSSYTGAYTNLTEKSNHTNTAVAGISPNLTYRGSNGHKVTKTSMSSTTYPKIYNRPRVDMTATQYGTSRAPLPNHNEKTDGIWSINDLLDKHEYSLVKHQNNINRIKKTINELKQ